MNVTALFLSSIYDAFEFLFISIELVFYSSLMNALFDLQVCHVN